MKIVHCFQGKLFTGFKLSFRLIQFSTWTCYSSIPMHPAHAIAYVYQIRSRVWHSLRKLAIFFDYEIGNYFPSANTNALQPFLDFWTLSEVFIDSLIDPVTKQHLIKSHYASVRKYDIYSKSHEFDWKEEIGLISSVL